MEISLKFQKGEVDLGLKYENVMLEDTKKLCEYDIKVPRNFVEISLKFPKGPLYLDFKPKTIVVLLPNDSTVTLTFDPFTTLTKVKDHLMLHEFDLVSDNCLVKVAVIIF